MKKRIRIFSPGTVSNVGSGFDIMGFGFDGPGDIIELELNSSGDIKIDNRSTVQLPRGKDNVIYPALKALLTKNGNQYGANVIIHNKIPPGSGIGSSAASSVAAVFGANILLGTIFSEIDLVNFAMQGEKLVSGAAHADNVAPCLMGGFTLVRSYDPIDIIKIPYPDDLFCSVVHPDIQLNTIESREIVKDMVSTRNAVVQTGNASALIAGLIMNDKSLIGRSVVDVIAEPVRKVLIPRYDEIKQKVYKLGALGFNISGSGPSLFAFSDSLEIAQSISSAIQVIFKDEDIGSNAYTSPISPLGVRVIS